MIRQVNSIGRWASPVEHRVAIGSNITIVTGPPEEVGARYDVSADTGLGALPRRVVVDDVTANG